MIARPIPVVLRRRRAQQRVASLISIVLALATLCVVATAGSAAGEPGVDVTEVERQRQRAHNAELAMKLDPATASTDQLIAAVTVLDQQISEELQRASEAQRAQADAERRMREARDALALMQPDLQEITNKLRGYAVRMYLDPEKSDNSLRLMRAEHFDDAERRRVFDDAVNGDSREYIERARVLRGRRDDLQAEAVSAANEADARKRERELLFQQVLAGQAAQVKLQAEWDKRVSGLAKSSDDIGDTSALDRAIAEQKAKLPPVAPSPVSSNGRMIRPVAGRVNDPFGYLSSRGRMHEGVDLAAATGTPVKAAQGGRVIHAGWEGAYGYSVVVDHGNGLQTRYAHLSKISVSVGGQISQGAQVGLSGATGQVTGPHLHFEVIRNGTRVNPANYIPL